jgi:hypothetical protein
MRSKNPSFDYTEVHEFRSNLPGFYESGTRIHSIPPNFASISVSRTSHIFMRKLCRSSGRSLQHNPVRRHFIGGAASLLAIFALSIPLAAQQSDPSASSQATQAQPAPQSQAAPEQSAQQTKRILGIIPNFRAVSADAKLPPQTAKDKFLDATHDSFDYSSVFIPAVLAGYSMARDTYPEFHQGGAGYARYLWHAAVDQTSENYMVEFIVPVITHEDTRYYTLGHGSFMHRTGYALSRAVITRSDSGKCSTSAKWWARAQRQAFRAATIPRASAASQIPQASGGSMSASMLHLSSSASSGRT